MRLSDIDVLPRGEIEPIGVTVRIGKMPSGLYDWTSRVAVRIEKMASGLYDWTRFEMTTSPILTAFTAFIVATAAVVSSTLVFYSYDRDFPKNILVEAHGMLLDILVMGIFILWLNKLGDKQLESRRYREEINDFRGWDSDEAGYRIAGNVKRLNSNKITDIKLEGCYLAKVNLTDAKLMGANLSSANLSSASLSGANLSRANLSHANLSHADLRDAKLDGARMLDANLSHANLCGAKLRDAILSQASPRLIPLTDVSCSLSTNPSYASLSANLSHANLMSANLRGAHILDANLRDANLVSANLSGADLWGAKLDDACMRDANLSHANLRDAHMLDADLWGANLSQARGWNNWQLAQAKSLIGATLPDGTVLTEEAWEEFKKRYGQSSQAE